MVQLLISGINEQHLVNKAISDLDSLDFNKIIIIHLSSAIGIFDHTPMAIKKKQ